jgi:hypothetical protein
MEIKVESFEVEEAKMRLKTCPTRPPLLSSCITGRRAAQLRYRRARHHGFLRVQQPAITSCSDTLSHAIELKLHYSLLLRSLIDR